MEAHAASLLYQTPKPVTVPLGRIVGTPGQSAPEGS